MKWFEGSINDALKITKEKNCFFALYVEGNDKLSEEMTDVINSPKISALLESDKFVSIRVKNNSREFFYFVEIYKFVPIPSLFLIGLNGFPVAVIQNSSSKDIKSIREKLFRVMSGKKDFVNQTSSQTNCCDINSVSDATETITTSASSFPNAIKISDFKVLNDDINGNPVQPVNESKNESSSFSGICGNVVLGPTRNETESVASKNEKVLLSVDCESPFVNASNYEQISPTENPRNEDLVLIAAENLPGNESVTREHNLPISIKEKSNKKEKEINNLKSQTTEKNDKKLRSQDRHTQERIKNKIQEDLDRQRILKEIAQDKEERRSRRLNLVSQPGRRNSKAAGLSGPEPTRLQTSIVSSSQTCIQFRHPNGSTFTALFNITNVISDLRTYVEHNIPHDFGQFDLATSFPRHVFTADENNRTLEDFQLVPNALVLILPVPQTPNTVMVISSRMYSAMCSLVSPVLALFRNIKRFFGSRDLSNIN